MGVSGVPSGTITNLATALGGATLTWIGSNITTVNAATWDAGNFTVASGGLLIVLFAGSLSTVVNGWTSVTVGANTATQWYNNPSGGHRYTIATIAVTAGTYDIKGTHDATTLNSAMVGVWLLQSYNFAAPTSISWEDSTSTTEPINYDQTYGGVFVACCMTTSAATNITWSSATARVNTNSGVGSVHYSYADKATPFTSSSQALETASYGGASITSTHLALVFV